MCPAPLKQLIQGGAWRSNKHTFTLYKLTKLFRSLRALVLER